MLRRFQSDERGISAVIVAVAIFALFGAAVLSLDFGNMYQTRRNIVTGTDASALQEAGFASTWTTSPSSCSATWTSAISNNAGSGATPLSCSITVTRTTDAGVPINGYVAVDARKHSEAKFGNVVGVNGASPYSLSVAQWGPPNGVIGLRPWGLCDQDPHFVEWTDYAARGYPTDSSDPYNQLRGSSEDHPAIAGAGVVHRIEIDNGGSTCGQAPGNWAWLDYDSSSNPTGAQREWWETGFSPTVYIHTGPDCTLEQAQDGDTTDGCIPGNTGNRGQAFDEQFEELKVSGKAVPIMVFSSLTGQGQISIFQASAFLSIIVRDYDVHGSRHYLYLEFVRHDWGGSCCDPDGPDTGVRVVKLCAIDHDVTGLTPASRCS